MNKRIGVITLSVSIILLSASAFLVTALKSFAQNQNAIASKPIIGLGCDGSSVYYFDSEYTLRRKPEGAAIKSTTLISHTRPIFNIFSKYRFQPGLMKSLYWFNSHYDSAIGILAYDFGINYPSTWKEYEGAKLTGEVLWRHDLNSLDFPKETQLIDDKGSVNATFKITYTNCPN